MLENQSFFSLVVYTCCALASLEVMTPFDVVVVPRFVVWKVWVDAIGTSL